MTVKTKTFIIPTDWKKTLYHNGLTRVADNAEFTVVTFTKSDLTISGTFWKPDYKMFKFNMHSIDGVEKVDDWAVLQAVEWLGVEVEELERWLGENFRYKLDYCICYSDDDSIYEARYE